MILLQTSCACSPEIYGTTLNARALHTHSSAKANLEKYGLPAMGTDVLALVAPDRERG